MLRRTIRGIKSFSSLASFPVHLLRVASICHDMAVPSIIIFIEDGTYEAKSKTELISLGYAQAKVKKSKRYNEDSFWEEFVYLLLIIKPNRAKTCLA